MGSSAVRIGKELRALIWPWCALTTVGALFLRVSINELPRSLPDTLLLCRVAGFWIGLPLLATLSMGHEFQHGTAPLLFAQPVDRSRIWREKWIVLVPAIAIAAFLYLSSNVGLGFPVGFGRFAWQERTFAIAWIVTATCTATFWTLVGRSILNGLVLNLIQGFLMFQIWQWMGPASSATSFKIVQSVPYVALIAATGYALLMLLLGRRKFVCFEVAGGSASADLLVPGSTRTSGTGSLLRSQPGQPILNLIRKEMRLLWLIWILIVVTVLGVLCLAALQFAPGYPLDKVRFMVSSFLLAVPALCAILAGSMSMGEERTSGTQAWHRTLPVWGLTLWAVKLGVVLFASFLALALPVIVAKFTTGQDFGVPFGFGISHNGWTAIFTFSALIGLSAFWCASAVKGTVRAALLTVPAIALIFLALQAAVFFVVMFLRTGIMDVFILMWPPMFLRDASGFQWLIEWFWIGPFIVAFFQTYRLFRTEVTERSYPFLKSLLTLAIVAILFGSAAWLPIMLVNRSDNLVYTAFDEANYAIARLRLNVGPPEAAYAKQFTLEDLSKAYSFSGASRKLLRGSTVSVSRNIRWRSRFAYSTTVRFRNGSICQSDGPYLARCDKEVQ